MIIPHKHHLKLERFKDFWGEQLSERKHNRMKPQKHRYNIFDQHSRNMKQIGDMIMAKKKKEEVKFEWAGYVNIDIPENRHSDLEIYIADDKQIFFQYNTLLTTNYQIKQYWDDYVEAIKTNAVCYDPESPNFGYALSSFADDWYTSLAVLCYKHFEYAQGDWKAMASNKIKKFG